MSKAPNGIDALNKLKQFGKKAGIAFVDAVEVSPDTVLPRTDPHPEVSSGALAVLTGVGALWSTHLGREAYASIKDDKAMKGLLYAIGAGMSTQRALDTLEVLVKRADAKNVARSSQERVTIISTINTRPEVGFGR